MILAGIALGTAMFVSDLIGVGEYEGVGPLQRNLIVAAGVLIILGLPLLRMVDKPA